MGSRPKNGNYDKGIKSQLFILLQINYIYFTCVRSTNKNKTEPITIASINEDGKIQDI